MRSGLIAQKLGMTRIYTEDLTGLERAVAARAPDVAPHHRVETAVSGGVPV